MIKYKLRFKTEQEIFEEYGQFEWRSRYRYSWVSQMDHLLGKEIEEKYYEKYIDKDGNFTMKDNEDHILEIQDSRMGNYWKVFLYQIKVIKIGVDYNEKKVLVYE